MSTKKKEEEKEQLLTVEAYQQVAGLHKILIRLAKLTLPADFKQSKEAWEEWKNTQM